MANVAKYTYSAVGHMFNHYGRREGDNVERSNKQIVSERTALNYNLAADIYKGVDKEGKEYDMTPKEILDKRLSKVKHLDLTKRKDINVAADWVITLPENVSIEKAEEFFRSAYEFCKERYGEENVVSAWVHMDETTPHMHFCFVPVVKDKDGTERLCAKERINRFELKQFHPNLQKYVEEKMEQEVAILNGATAGGNLTIVEMELRKALKELAAVKAQTASIEIAQPIINEFIGLMNKVGAEYEVLDKALKSKKWFGDDDKAKMEQVTAELDNLKKIVANASETTAAVITTFNGLDDNINKYLNKVYDNLKGFEKRRSGVLNVKKIN